MPLEWAKEDHFGLNRHARQKVRDILPEGVSSFDLRDEEDGKRKLLGAIYEALAAKGVRYEHEPPTNSAEHQWVRTWDEVLDSRQGTCLDLALLFSSFCVEYNLCPFVIVLEGHALIAVSLMNTLHSWRSRAERNIFDKVVVNREEQKRRLVELIEQGSYLAIECTGFASSMALKERGDSPECLGRGDDGCQTFAAAVEAGERQLLDRLRPFLYAIDVGRAHLARRPGDADAWTGVDEWHSGDASDDPNSDPLPYLLDRNEQEESLGDALLSHQETKPRRPLLCIIHGDEYEGHKHFLDRMEKKSLPALLRFWLPEEADGPVLARDVRLSLTQAGGDNWRDVFWQDIADGLIPEAKRGRGAPTQPAAGASTADAVVNTISGQRLAIMLRVTLSSSTLSGVPLDRLGRFLEFLNDWPNSSGRALFIVCLNFKYERKFDGWKILWLRRQRLNDNLRRYISSLDFTRYTGLYGVCLPELSSITRRDAEDAVNHRLVQRWCRKKLSELDVINLYNSRLCTTDGVPMIILIDEFRKKLG